MLAMRNSAQVSETRETRHTLDPRGRMAMHAQAWIRVAESEFARPIRQSRRTQRLTLHPEPYLIAFLGFI